MTEVDQATTVEDPRPDMLACGDPREGLATIADAGASQGGIASATQTVVITSRWRLPENGAAVARGNGPRTAVLAHRPGRYPGSPSRFNATEHAELKEDRRSDVDPNPPHRFPE